MSPTQASAAPGTPIRATPRLVGGVETLPLDLMHVLDLGEDRAGGGRDVGHHVAVRDPLRVGREGGVLAQGDRPPRVAGTVAPPPRPRSVRLRVPHAAETSLLLPLRPVGAALLRLARETATVTVDMVTPLLRPTVPRRLAMQCEGPCFETVPETTVETAVPATPLRPYPVEHPA